jgi:hypothetical protein
MNQATRFMSMGVALATATLLATPAATGAATPDRTRTGPQPSVTGHTITTQVTLPAAECLAPTGAGAPRPARGQTAPCSMQVTMDLAAERLAPDGRPSQPISASSGSCVTTWIIRSEQAAVQSVFWGAFWSAKATATGYGDSCGRVLWTSVTCDQHGIGFSVRIDWCGAYPQRWTWYRYTDTNFGLNITVSAIANGTPIAFTHGARNGFNPYTGKPYGYFYW